MNGQNVNRRVAPHRVDQDEGFAVLVTSRVEKLVVLRGELPVEKQQRRVPVGLGIRREAGRQQRGGGLRVGPVFDTDDVARVVPGAAPALPRRGRAEFGEQ